MSYSLTTLCYDWRRYLPGVLAVAFSALLIALNFGLLKGLFSITSLPIDHTRADIWMGAPNVPSVDLAQGFGESALAYLASQPEVKRTEVYFQGFSYWVKPNGGTELCMIVGSALEPDSLGRVEDLDARMCALLSEPGTVVVDESDKDRLGIKSEGDTAEINGQRVRVVAFTKKVRSLAGPYVFCSRTTARTRLRLYPHQISYVLAECYNPADAPTVVKRMEEKYGLEQLKKKYGDRLYPEAAVFSFATSKKFSDGSQMHWLTKTKAGIALGYAAALALLVGAVVTSQTLYAATIASLREFAVLRALGIPRWRMQLMVLSQSFWIGIIGVSLAFISGWGLVRLAEWLTVPVHTGIGLLASTVAVTLAMAMLSGLYALRSLRQVEPATLLR